MCSLLARPSLRGPSIICQHFPPKRRGLHTISNHVRHHKRRVTSLYIQSRHIAYDEIAVTAQHAVQPPRNLITEIGYKDGMEAILDPVIPDQFTNIVETLPSLLSNPLPTNVLCHVIDYFQQTTALPWCVALAGVGVGVRCLLYPVHIMMRQELQSFVKTCPQQMNVFFSMYYQNVVQHGTKKALEMAFEAKREFCLSSNMVEYPCLKQLTITAFTAIPMALSVLHLCNLTYAPLLTGGMYWFTNLSTCDPYMVLPLINSVILLALIANHPTGWILPVPNTTLGPRYKVPLFCLWLPQILLPSGLLCYFIGTNTLGLVIMLMLKVGPIRNVHGLVGKTDLLMPFIQNPNLLLGLGEHVKIARQELKELESGEAMARALEQQGVTALEGGLSAQRGLVNSAVHDIAVEGSNDAIIEGSDDVAQGGFKDVAMEGSIAVKGSKDLALEQSTVQEDPKGIALRYDANMELVAEEKRDPNDPEGVPPPVQDWTKNRRY